MKFLCLLLSAILLAGCATHRKGYSRYDPYDAVTVDQMVGNNVSHAVLQKVIVCVNARRETRRVTAITNVNVWAVTNLTVAPNTNLTISIATNYLVTSMTNILPAFGGATVSAGEGTEAPVVPPPPETNTVLVMTNPGPTFSTNVTVSVAANASATRSPNQNAANAQQVRTVSNQITTSSNNISVSVLTNYVVTSETNHVISYATNVAVISMTNIMVMPTNGVVYDYFLYTELTPPSDFTLAPGESLILLVDGVRYGFTTSTSGTAFVGRRGFTSGLYRVPGEVLVAIANAQEVKVRFKGVNSVIEREMSASSRENFRKYLAKYFVPQPTPAVPEKMAAAGAPFQSSTR
jgi:hypothetical protein